MASRTSKKKKRTAIVPRAVFAAAVALGTVPSLEACHAGSEPEPRRAAELRPVTPPSSPPPPPPPQHEQAPPREQAPPPIATLEPIDAGVDAGIDAGIDAGSRHAHRHVQQQHRVQMLTVAVRVPYPVAYHPPPPPPTVAAPPPYGVAARRFSVADVE